MVHGTVHGCTEGAGRGRGKRAITVQGQGGDGGVSDNGATGVGKGQGQRAITVHGGDGARVHGKAQGEDGRDRNGARGRCTGLGKGQGGGRGRER